jgi:hypothetical protein
MFFVATFLHRQAHILKFLMMTQGRWTITVSRTIQWSLMSKNTRKKSSDQNKQQLLRWINCIIFSKIQNKELWLIRRAHVGRIYITTTATTSTTATIGTIPGHVALLFANKANPNIFTSAFTSWDKMMNDQPTTDSWAKKKTYIDGPACRTENNYWLLVLYNREHSAQVHHIWSKAR